MPSLARRLWKWSAALVATLLIVLAIGVGLFRLAVPRVPALRADAESTAAQALGWPVHIGAIDLQWALLGPELVLTDVQLLAPATREAVMSAAQVDLVFGLMDLFQDAPRPQHVRLHQPTLALERTADGRLYLSGYALPVESRTRLDWREALSQMLRHGQVTVLGGELHYRDTARGIEDWTLRLAEVSLASDGENHVFEGNVLPPGTLGEQVLFEFTAAGPPVRPETWDWSLGLGGRALNLDGWYQQFSWAGPGHLSGAVDFAAQLHGAGLARVAGGGGFRAAGLAFAGLEPAVTAPFERLAFDWTLEYEQQQESGDSERFALNIDRLEIEREGRLFTGGGWSVRQDPAADHPLEITGRQLPLAELAALARFLPFDDVRQHMERLAPRGELRELALALDPAAEPARFRIETVFENLGFAPQGDFPGASGLSGSLQGDQATGWLRLDSVNARFDFGALFRSPLPAQQLVGEIGWEARDGGWRIVSEEFVVENPEVQAQARFTLDLPADAPAVIDMTATAANVDFRARSTWLPVGIMSDGLVHWLDTAVVAGRAPEATLALRGPLEKFPFRDGGGVFDIRFRAEDTVVDYAPGWPRLEGLSADVHFHGAGLDIGIDRARVLDGLRVENGHARFADLADGELETRAQVGGDMDAAWRFLALSPLVEPLRGLLDAVAVTGPMQADVNLHIPLADVDRTRLRVDARLQGVRAHPVALPWAVEELRGMVTVTESDITAERLEGHLHGHAFTAAIGPLAPVTEGFAVTRVTLSGRSDVADFGDYLPLRWRERLDGTFDWAGELRIPADEGGVVLDVASDLAGVTSTLPAPLDGSLDRLGPARLHIPLPDDARVDAAFQVREVGRGRLNFVRAPAGWRFDRGRLVLDDALNPDAAAPELPDEPGLWLAGRTPVLDAAWLALGDEAAGANETGEFLVRGFDVRADRFLFGDIVLAGQALRGNRGEDSWDIALDGPAAGQIIVPSGQDWPWQVRLEHLRLPAAEERPDSAPPPEDTEPPDPRRLPGLHLDIGAFQVGTRLLGHVSGDLRRTVIGYTTDNLTIRTLDFDLGLTGRWEYVEDGHYTSLSADFLSRDLGDTIDRLGLEGGMDADTARITAHLAWHGAPLDPAAGRLEGTVALAFEDGALLDVSPGAGRLLGLLSITALPRRLTLDFSDLFGAGLQFDTLAGDFLVTGGSAYTTNLRLDGPSISALVVGRTGLVDRDYDQLAIVDPGVSASIPVAGYLAAGPTVGAALLLLSQLLKAPLEDITQVKYRITGSWEDPVIEQVRQDRNAQQTPQTNH